MGMRTAIKNKKGTQVIQSKSRAKHQGSHDSILQNYKDKTAQLQSVNEEELLQGKFDTAQRMGIDEEEPIQEKFETTQLATEEKEPLQRQPNNTGLPDNLKSGIENLSGYSMNDVKVHYNSSQPATLQAHAYAQGTDIHVAPGQEKHLPHEAWHVVQQKQGRVKPTMQMKGRVPVNDDVGLEKEADVMGAKAMQGNFAHALPTTNPVQQATASFQLQPVVQRALGFEFETGWKIWDYTPVKIWEKSGKQGEIPNLRPLSKKEAIYDGAGFKVEADEAGGGEAEMEFIIHPPVDANVPGKQELFSRMTYMTVLGAKIIRAANNSGGNLFRLSTATNDSFHEKFVVQPLPNELEARPQVTAGISLGKIPELENQQGTKDLHPMFNHTKKTIKSHKNNVGDLSNYPPFDVTPMSDELKGLFILMGSYISNGEQAIFYPKQIADSSLLARTDFARLYKMIPENEQLFFKKNPSLWVRYALIAAGVDHGESNEPVIGKVWTDEKMTNRRPIGPSREKWLTFIRFGYDLLSAAHHKEYKSTYQGTEDEGTGKKLESLGELGSKTEKVGSEQKDGGIFEFRSAALANKTGILPLLDWQPFTRNTMDYFVELEK